MNPDFLANSIGHISPSSSIEGSFSSGLLFSSSSSVWRDMICSKLSKPSCSFFLFFKDSFE
uniref:Uncharacterized protein n=1 Tax=Lepeophtheirus salmonis TaxID=72036 RepID=A0A0K2UI98_LEPSM